MAEYSTAEDKLLELIPAKDPLRTNLAELREAVEKIWDAGSPRVIQGFTDHGIKHYERIAKYAAKLLEANQGKTLSKEEAYLLLAGIYIHDIGMQCDIARSPEIKEQAIALGAKFEIEEFKATDGSNYSQDEQKDIRKNHHWLSIAWVDVARKSPENTLHKAASAIPKKLVSDLKNVCLHHTKLPITSCNISLKYFEGRLQFVAALLRFADELDIAEDRVNIETVKMFSFSPANSVYWWLHEQATITFPAPAVVKILVGLHDNDYAEFSKIVTEKFINDFRTKNRPVLTVLAKNSVSINVDDDSAVIKDEDAEQLPDEIRLELRSMMQPSKNPLEDLAEEVRLWLQAIRYEVSESPKFHAEVAEMTATLDTGTIKQCVLVRCVARAIAVEDVQKLDQALSRKVNQGWLISDRSVSDEVRRSLEGTEVVAFRLSEFLKERVWGSYIDALTSLVERDRIPELYVDIGCYRQPFHEANAEEATREKYESLDAAINEWLGARDKMHVSLLGEFGSGKTWFCRHYAYRQLKKYLDNPAKERFPLLITLRNFTKAATAKELITHAIVDQYQLSFVGDPYDIFDELNRRGKILLILDGFDEMARRVDKQTMVDNFWELAKLVDDNSKVILTSRTEYFRWAKEAESVLGGQELGRQMAILQPPKFDVLYLEPFTDDQIRTVIMGRLGKDGDKTADKLLGNENLKEMARKPVLVELLLAAAEEADADLLTDQAAVYLYATNKLLLRNITEQRTFTSTSDKLLFLCELAWQMIESGELRIHYKDIPDRIRQHFPEIKDDHEVDHWDFDLRNQTLLRPDLQGYYEFSHKSLAEFFVAFKFAAELGWLSAPFTDTYEEEGGELCKLPFTTLANEQLAVAFGAKNIGSDEMLAVRTFLLQMITDNEESLLRMASLADELELKFTTPNAATLLSELGHLANAENLIALDLRGAVLRTSQLREKNVNESVFALATIYVDDAPNLNNGGIGHGVIKGCPCIVTQSEMIVEQVYAFDAVIMWPPSFQKQLDEAGISLNPVVLSPSDAWFDGEIQRTDLCLQVFAYLASQVPPPSDTFERELYDAFHSADLNPRNIMRWGTINLSDVYSAIAND